MVPMQIVEDSSLRYRNDKEKKVFQLKTPLLSQWRFYIT
jgi:hypothetical protein